MLVYAETKQINEIGDAMKSEAFRQLLVAVGDLTPHQRQWLSDELKGRGQAAAVRELLEDRLPKRPACPSCGHGQVWRWGKASGLQRYRCMACHSTFNTLTGTPLARLRHKEIWLQQAEQLVLGNSIRRSAAACGVHRNTAFRWRHRFLAWPRQQQVRQLSGIAEADETYFLESAKGCKHGLNRRPRRRGGKAAKRGLSSEQIPVLICRDRAGNTADFVLDKADKEHLTAALKPVLARDSILCSDSSKALAATAHEIGVVHRAVNLASGIRCIAGVYHVQNVNAYDSRLKEWLRRFHGVASDYLPNYLGWRRLIERNDNRPAPRDVMKAALGWVVPINI